MNEGKFDVNRLRIASPCQVPWESMAGDDRTRHCDLCSLNVYNVSELSKAEVEKLVGAHKTRLCMRLYRRSDGTVLTKDCPVGLRAIRRRVSRITGAAFASILGLFSVSFGQKDDTKPIDATKINIVRTVSANEGSKLSGTISDQNGALIPNAKIVLSSEKNEIVSKSDDEGNYPLTNLVPGKYNLKVASGYFNDYRLKNLVIKENENLQLDIHLKASGEVVGLLVLDSAIELETDSSMIKTVITSKMIDSTPH